MKIRPNISDVVVRHRMKLSDIVGRHRMCYRRIYTRIILTIIEAILNFKVNKFYFTLFAFVFMSYICIIDKYPEHKISCTSVSYEDIVDSDQENPYLIQFIWNNVISPPSKRGYNLVQPFLRDLSQFYQSTFIEDFFKKKKNGTYIEAGALDGETNSNTLLFERVHRWRGLLVEPNPENFQEILKKSRKVHLAECCLSTTQKHITVFVSIDEDQSTIVNSTDTNLNVDRFAVVDCYPLYSLMVAANLTSVDLLVLDLGGAQLKVLQTLPWDKIEVKSILIEFKNVPEGKIYLKNFLEKKNFELINEWETDYFFVNKETKIL